MSHPDGTQLRVSRQELARLVGCSREMAGRVLKKLQADGKLPARGKTVVVYGTPCRARKSVVWGKRASARVDAGGRRSLTTQKQLQHCLTHPHDQQLTIKH